MSKYYLMIVLLSGILLSGCSNHCHESADLKKSQTEKQILDKWEKITTAIENSDTDGYANLIGSDFIIMSSNGSVFYSKAEYIDNVRSWFATREKTEIQPEKITVSVLATDLALLDQLSVFQVSDKDGSVQRVRHAVSFVFKKEPAGWMIIHGHESFLETE